MIWSSLKSGLARAWSTKRLLLVLYLANLLVGLSVALPLRKVLLGFGGSSLAGSELVHGVTVDFLAELITANRAAAPALVGMLVFGSAASWLLSLFLSGGALAILAGDGRYRADEFWGAAAKFFGRFLRLTLWSILLLAVLSLLPLATGWTQRLAFGPDPYQYVSYWGPGSVLGSSSSLSSFSESASTTRAYMLSSPKRGERGVPSGRACVSQFEIRSGPWDWPSPLWSWGRLLFWPTFPSLPRSMDRP